MNYGRRISRWRVGCYWRQQVLVNLGHLQAIGADAVRQGKTVIHYTLELNAQYVGLRYDTIVSGQPTANLQYHKEEVLKKINQLKGELVIKYYPTRTASINTITAHLQQCELQGIKPDMVLVDYADIMKSTQHFSEKDTQ